MIQYLKKLFTAGNDSPVPPDEHQLAVAATALMVQVAQVDHNQDEAELATIVDYAARSRQITKEEAEEILRDALAHASDAISLYEFTRLINDSLDQEAKQVLLEHIWRVAFADGRIDKYEEHLIRRIADLLHLNHREYMQARHRAETRTG